MENSVGIIPDKNLLKQRTALLQLHLHGLKVLSTDIATVTAAYANMGEKITAEQCITRETTPAPKKVSVLEYLGENNFQTLLTICSKKRE